METEQRNGLAALLGRSGGCEAGALKWAATDFGDSNGTALLDFAAGVDLVDIGFFGNETFGAAGPAEWDDLRPTAAKRKARGEEEGGEGEAAEGEEGGAAEEEEEDEEDEDEEDEDLDEDEDDEDEDEDDEDEDEDEEDDDFDDPDEDDDYDDDEDDDFDDDDE